LALSLLAPSLLVSSLLVVLLLVVLLLAILLLPVQRFHLTMLHLLELRAWCAPHRSLTPIMLCSPPTWAPTMVFVGMVLWRLANLDGGATIVASLRQP
jgi:hypothetical protein